MVKDIVSLPYPIGDFDNATSCEAIGLILNDVYKTMGLSKDYDVDTLSDLIEWIRFNNQDLHPLEIKIAFDMCLAGKIRIEYMSKDLSKKTLGQVIGAYRTFKSRLLSPVNNGKAPIVNKDPNSPEKLREKHIEFLKTIVELYHKFKQGADISSHYLLSVAYDALAKYEIEIDKNSINPQVKEKANQIAKHRWSHSNPSTPFPLKDRGEQLCMYVYKELMVIRAFNAIKSKNINLETALMSKVR